jgi:ubiquinol-cytochrome c reductase cytochrome b subunit
VLAMPFIARLKNGHSFNVAVTAALLLAVAWWTYGSWAKDAADEQHLAAICDERCQAERVRLLADHEGIPPGGGLALLKSDPKTQGPKLFKMHCASCHNYSDGSPDDILAEKPTAPNLRGYATRRWIFQAAAKGETAGHGILDAANVAGPDYFGNTAFKKKEMVGFIKSQWRDAKEDDSLDDLRDTLTKVAAALSAEAGLSSQADVDARDEQVIKEGRKLIESTCTDCHRFGKKAGAGAPELVGYGSRQWIMGITSNPATPRFYGDHNDRMPAYAETLSARDIGVLADWLRSDWYEER